MNSESRQPQELGSRVSAEPHWPWRLLAIAVILGGSGVGYWFLATDRRELRSTYQTSGLAELATSLFPPAEAPLEASSRSFATEESSALRATGFVLELKEKGSGRELAGGSVRFLDLSHGSAPESAFDVALHGESGEGRFSGAREFIADERGQVWLPRFRAKARVLATWQGLSTQAGITAGDQDPLRLELSPEPARRVRLRGPDGSPVFGLPISVRDGDSLTDLWRGVVTDPSGELVLPSGLPVRRPGEARIGLSIPSFEMITEPWPELEGGVVDIAVPPLGSLLVRLRPANLGPELGSLVACARAKSDTSPDRIPHWLWARPTRFEGGMGARIWVPLNGRFDVRVQSAKSYRQVEVAVDGPTTPGQEISVELDLGARYPEVFGRIQDPLGQAWGNTPLRVHLITRSAGGRGVVGEPLLSDAGGRFVFPLRAASTDNEPRTLEASIFDPDREQITGFCSVAVPESVNGSHDLGDLRLGPAPLLVSGWTQDERGNPLRGVVITMESRAAVHDGPWSGESEDTVVSDAQGRFEIRGQCDGPALRLLARRTGFLGLTTEALVPGALGLRLTLPDAASLAGRVLVEEGVDVSLLSVVLETRGKGAVWDVRSRVQPSRDGTFLACELPRGLYRASVVLPDDARAIVALDGVVVDDSSGGGSLRRCEIDLRGTVQSVPIHVESESGSPLPDAWVLLLPKDDQARARWQRVRDGRAQVIFRPGSLAAAVTASGHVPEFLSDVAAPVKVKLRTGHRVEVRVSGGGESVTAPHALVGRIWPTQTPPGWPPELLPKDGAMGIAGELTFDAAGVAHAVVPWPGPYRASLTLQRRGGGLESAVSVPDSGHGLFQVQDSPLVQQIELAVTAESMAEAKRAFQP